MKRKSIVWSVVVVVFLIATGHWVRRTVQIDSCLDGGGHWNYQQSLCEFR